MLEVLLKEIKKQMVKLKRIQQIYKHGNELDSALKVDG
jgi:hypothetical protein